MTDKVRDSAIDSLAYVQAMLLDLKTICDAERCTFLIHLLEMAYIESGDRLHGLRTRRGNRG